MIATAFDSNITYRISQDSSHDRGKHLGGINILFIMLILPRSHTFFIRYL